ncbi:MAG: citrate (pro-3S)-lyase subunit beta [Prevotella sp.]|nr:citrate (pro-3S)-lyase subunit beta [Prevotella sp.]
MQRLRRTMMFVPGNNPGMMSDAHIYGPDSIMLDLEDSVTMAEKDAARLLVYNALKTIDYGDTEMVVRINPLNTPYGKKDVEAVVKAGVDVIRMPKTETAEEVHEVEEEILKWEKELGCVGRTKIMAAIESALGIVNAYPIATASKRMMGIALGAEDYCANLKTQRTQGDNPNFGIELLQARQMIVVAARAAGIDALDTVYSNLNDMDTFRREVELIKALGFDGKSIINPRQIEIINEVFAPKEKDIEKALKVLAAIKEAEAKGSGVIAVNGKMVDKPVVIRAQHTIDLAIASGVLNPEDIA